MTNIEVEQFRDLPVGTRFRVFLISLIMKKLCVSERKYIKESDLYAFVEGDVKRAKTSIAADDVVIRCWF